MKETNSSQSNSEANFNYSTVDRTARILANGSQGEIIAEIERLEQQNAEFNNIKGINDLFIHHDRSESDLLDEMVAEFGLEFPDFDIFNYVDPALDAALDAGAADVLNRIDCEIPQPDINLKGNCKPINLNSFDMSSDVQTSLMVEQREELQSLKSQLQKQQELISELQKQLNNFMAVQPTNTQKSLEEVVEQREVEQESTHAKNVDVGNLPANNYNLDSNSLPSVPERESMPVHTRQQCNRKSIATPRPNNEVVIAYFGVHRDVSPHPKQTFSNLIQSEAGSSTKDKKARPIRKKKREVERCDLSRIKSGSNIRKRSETYTCVECNYRCSFNSSLIRHLRVHTGEKPFKCRVCQKSFSQTTNLRRHLRIHTGEKPYKCQICNLSFTRLGHLNTHLPIHTGEKPFQCDICKKTFSSKTSLLEHMNIHSGNKPHKCKVCKEAFRQQSALRSHRRVHTE